MSRDLQIKIEVLELFASAHSDYFEAAEYVQQKDYVPVIKHDRAKRAWREANKAKQRLYSARYAAKKRAERKAQTP